MQSQVAHRIQPFRFSYHRSGHSIQMQHDLFLPEFGLTLLHGQSGSGKSTFIQLLLGGYPHDLHGQLEGTNPSLATLALQHNVLSLSQNPIYQLATTHAVEEFYLTMELAQRSKEWMIRQESCIAAFSISSHLNQLTQNLSPGIAQRLLLASLMANQPEIIILDEPTAFLNPEMRLQFYETLSELKKSTSIILIDHHYSEVKPLLDQLWTISSSGQIEAPPLQTNLSLNSESAAKSLDTWLTPFKNLIPKQQKPYVLSIEDLSIGYKSTEPLIHRINTQIHAGQCAVITGDNGSGKTTWVHTLLGLVKKIGGNVKLTSSDTSDAFLNQHVSEQISMVFQQPESHFYFDTVQEELNQLGMTAEQQQNVLACMNLSHLSHLSPYQLSEGQKRRLSLLIPCCLQYPIVIFDEPTFGQDQAQIVRILGLIQVFKERNYIVLIISHDLALLQTVADLHWRIEDKQLKVSVTCPM